MLGSPTERTLKKIQPLVAAISALEPRIEKLSDARDFQTALRIAHKAQRRSSADDIVLPPDAGGGGVA